MADKNCIRSRCKPSKKDIIKDMCNSICRVADAIVFSGCRCYDYSQRTKEKCEEINMLQIIATCINVLFVFVLLLVPGFFSAKKGFINSNQVDGLSFITTNFLWPALIVDVMPNVERSEEMIEITIYTAVLSFAYFP